MNNLTVDNIAASLKTAPEILGKDKYFNSAVLIPLFEKENELHVLFEKRATTIRQGGEVSFPGGEFDPLADKNLAETAIRETTEELRIEKDKIIFLGRFGTLVAPMGVAVDAFTAYLEIDNIYAINFDKTEVEKIFSVPLNYFFNNRPDEYNVRLEVHPSVLDENGNPIELLPVGKLGLPEKYAKPWTKGKHRVLVYKNTEEVIWGITAEIIFEFINHLKNKNEF
ncbi:MAG: CoA pyrophosphatase [Ignavibacteriaceae bacterium]|nr:CoA pyrophosphatase [Ignavibacteriaceae bacterium]